MSKTREFFNKIQAMIEEMSFCSFFGIIKLKLLMNLRIKNETFK
jgi:hypothetical protein